eukprot:COSAG02_NODE_49718_length_325_cov_0.681416_1_plen_47_part_10
MQAKRPPAAMHHQHRGAAGTFLLSYPQFINFIPFSYPVKEKAFLYSR